MLSLFAIILLPRQFHISVVENTTPRHIPKAMWVFPLYLLLINIFVFPIALAGKMMFESASTPTPTC
jgi:Na+/proline symporter